MARVNDIRYVGYGTPDVTAERDFYVDAWKLKEVPSDDGMIYLATEGKDEKYVVRLRKTEEVRIDVISWAAPDREAVNALFEQVKAAGGKVVTEPGELTTLGDGYGFRFFDPNGLTIEVSSDVEKGEARKLASGEPLPEKISHVVLHAPDHKATVKFYEEALGFRVSDWLGDFMCFLRCNEWHHRLAILPGPPCLNHVAYDVPNVDSVMKGIARLREYERDVVWGPGRHTAGNNIFSYFITPAGFVVEYTTDLEQVDEDTWEAKVREPKKDTMDQWGMGVGGPQTMPQPQPDAGLFKAPEV